MSGKPAPFYIPSLDGVRAAAFLIVFLSHSGYGKFIPGRFGVTVFFFLSGYLIATLLRREFEQYGMISLRNFYLRRVLRIFPPMYLIIAAATLALALGFSEHAFHVNGWLGQVAHMTNYVAIYWDDPALLPGTEILWSLAVEEHYYLVFPLLFLWLMRSGVSYRKQALIYLGICAVVLAWRMVLVYGYQASDARTAFATDTRVDSILFGAILAVFHNPQLDPPAVKSTLAKMLLLGGGLGLLLFCFLYRDEGFRSGLRFTLQGIGLFPCFYVIVREPNWPIIRWLNIGWVKFIGVLSYSAYLFHMLLIHIYEQRFGELDHLPALLLLGLTLLVAYAVYVVVEKPAARLRRRLHAPTKAQSLGATAQTTG